MDDGQGHTYQWEGKTVEVSARPIWKYLGLVASLDVTVDGKRVLATGGKFKMQDTESVDFDIDGRMHLMDLKWRVRADGNDSGPNVQPIGYELVIDGRSMGKSTIYYNYFKQKLVATLVIGGAALLYLCVGMGLLAAKK